MKPIPLDNAKFIQKSSISDSLIELIKQQILTGELSPGERIVETKIAKEYGISQTPVREAIRILAGEGIVTIVPNKGPLVREFELKDIYEIYSLRAMMEGLAIRLAIRHASDSDIAVFVSIFEGMKQKLLDDTVHSLTKDSFRIHQSIVELSHHTRLIDTYKSLSFQIAMVNRNLGRESTKQKEIDQHADIIDALERRDPAYAEHVIKKHIYQSYTEYIQLKYPQEIQSLDDAWY